MAEQPKVLEVDSVMHSKNSLAVAQSQLSTKENDEIISNGKKSLAIAQESRDKDGEMNAYMLLSEAHLSEGEYENVISYGEKCFAIAQECDSEVAIKACTTLGKAYLKKKEYDDAIFYSEICLVIAEECGDRDGVRDAYKILGEAYWKKKEYDDAIFYSEICLAIAEEYGDRDGEMNAYGLLGEAHLDKKEYDDAIFYGKNCLAIAAKESGSKESEIGAYKVIMLGHLSKGEYDDAVLNARKCLAIAQESGNRNGELNSLMILCKAQFGKGEFSDSLLLSEKCVTIAQESGDLMMLQEAQTSKINAMYWNNRKIQVRNMKAKFHEFERLKPYVGCKGTPLKKEDYEDAVSSTKRCLTIAQERNNKELEGFFCLWLGSIHLDNDNFNDAHYYFKIGEQLENKTAVLMSKLYLCNIYDSLGMKEELLLKSAEIYFSEEWETFKSFISSDKNRSKPIRDLLERYINHVEQDEYEQASCCLEELISTEEKVSGHINPALLFTKCSLSEMFALQGQYHKGIQHYQEVLNIALKQENKHLVAKCHFELGAIYFKLGEIKKAEDSARKSLQCFEFLFDHVGQNEQFKIAIVEKYKRCYKLLFKVLVESDKKEAFLLADHYRARALKDILVSKYRIKIDSSRETLRYTDVQSLVSSRNYALLFYSTSLEELCTFLVQEGNQLEFSLQNFKCCDRCLDQLVHDAFEDMQVREVVGCEDRSLGAIDDFEENKFTNYTEHNSVNGTGQCHSCVGRGNSSQTIDDIERNLTGCLEILYHKIIHNVKGLITQDEIVIIPEGALFQVPFPALWDPDTGQYLSETKRIRLAPSIATLKLLQECPMEHHHSKDALVIGDPSVGRVILSGIEKEFDPLEGALEEAADIALILEVCPVLGYKATKPLVLQKLQQGVSIVHIAAHGSLEKATIVLAPSPEIRAIKIPDEEDYMLTMADVQQAQIRAQLVVLSCCHSGRGQIKAEGVVGMCRAFLASGARAVVGSLWAIDDLATRKFMKKFYKYLKDGKSASTSLHLAMNDLRRKPQYSEPRYWAPFFLMGDDVTITL